MSTKDKNVKLIDLGVVAVSLYFVGSCDLQCTYCFQPKIKNHMKEENDKIREWLESGKMEEDVLEIVGRDIEALSLWGGEPSINLSSLTKRLATVYLRFPKLNAFSWSSNFASDRALSNTKDFCNEISRLNRISGRNVNIDLQISIDGPPEVNDKNRIGSRAERIMTHTTEFFQFLEENKYWDFVSVHFKGTHGSESLEYLAQEDHLEKHYRYFDEYRAKWEEMKLSVIPRGAEVVTLVVPGNYTQKDGYSLKKILQKLYSSEFQKGPWKAKTPPIFSFQSADRLHHLLENLIRGNVKKYKTELSFHTSCSAGRSCVGLSYGGKVHWCQSTFFFDDETIKYIQENNLVTDFEKNQGFSFQNFDNYIRGVEVTPAKNPLAVYRSLTIPREFISDHAFRSQQISLMITELALAGQIDRKYIEDIHLQNIVVSYLLYGGHECPANNVWEFGSVWIRNSGFLKLLLNGAFDIMIEQLKREGL